MLIELYNGWVGHIFLAELREEGHGNYRLVTGRGYMIEKQSQYIFGDLVIIDMKSRRMVIQGFIACNVCFFIKPNWTR